MNRQHIIDNYGFDPNNYTLAYNFHFLIYSPEKYTHDFYFISDISAREMYRYSVANKRLERRGRFQHYGKCDLDYLEDGEGTRPFCQLFDTKIKSLMIAEKNKRFITGHVLYHIPTGNAVIVNSFRFAKYFNGRGDTGLAGVKVSMEE